MCTKQHSTLNIIHIRIFEQQFEICFVICFHIKIVLIVKQTFALSNKVENSLYDNKIIILKF